MGEEFVSGEGCADDLFESEKVAIVRNLARLRGEIAAAGGGAVRLLAATKTRSAQVINFAARECGLTLIGENRVQELLAKYDSLDRGAMEIRFIGRLQSNKVKYIIDKVSMVESLDSLSLARELDRQAERVGRTIDCLVEVNCGHEEAKGGVPPEMAAQFLTSLSSFPHIAVRGLMTIGPRCAREEDYRVGFSRTRALFDELSGKLVRGEIALPGASMEILSMGMSDSYLPAIACGATEVRVGSGIFGAREPG